jgi:hypothetical protein
MEKKELFFENISQKEFYTKEEKAIILKKLNDQRLIRQKNTEVSSQEKNNEIEEKRLKNKKEYKINNKQFYKFQNMERGYYIEKEKAEKISTIPMIMTLYYKTFGELKKKDVLIKLKVYSENFFISYDVLRVYFKPYALEEIK